MMRRHYRSRPGLKAQSGLKPRANQQADSSSEQAQLLKGLPGSPSQHQRRLDKWIAGVDDFDQELKRWANKQHVFKPVREGLDLCAKCDQAQGVPVAGRKHKKLHVTPKELAEIQRIIRVKRKADHG